VLAQSLTSLHLQSPATGRVPRISASTSARAAHAFGIGAEAGDRGAADLDAFQAGALHVEGREWNRRGTRFL